MGWKTSLCTRSHVGLLLWVVINILRYVGWPWLLGCCCCCCCCCGVLCRPAALGGHQHPQVRQLALVGELLLLLLLLLWGSLSACCSGWLSTFSGKSAGLGCGVVAVVVVGFSVGLLLWVVMLPTSSGTLSCLGWRVCCGCCCCCVLQQNTLCCLKTSPSTRSVICTVIAWSCCDQRVGHCRSLAL